MQAISTAPRPSVRDDALVGSLLTVTCVLKKLRGGSQSSLVRCSDGKLYVMKVSSNPQGVQVLANEVMGACLMQGLGLPVPTCRRVLLTQDIIRAFPSLQLVDKDGITRNPEEGEQFASEFLLKADHELFDKPWASRPRLEYNAHTVPMYIFDLWSLHKDLRQCVFRRNKRNGSWETFFIDNGFLFGGPEWKDVAWGVATSRSDYFSAPAAADPLIDTTIARFKFLLPELLQRAAQQVPKNWIRGDLSTLQKHLLIRLSHLHILVAEDLARNAVAQTITRTGRSLFAC